MDLNVGIDIRREGNIAKQDLHLGKAPYLTVLLNLLTLSSCSLDI